MGYGRRAKRSGWTDKNASRRPLAYNIKVVADLYLQRQQHHLGTGNIAWLS